MKFHRSLIWRVSLVYAALTLFSLAVLAIFLTGTLRNQSTALLEERQERDIRLIAAAAVPYLSEPDSPSNRTALQSVSVDLARTVSSPVTIFSETGVPLAASQGDLDAVEDRASSLELGQIRQDESYRSVSTSDSFEFLSITAPVFAGDELVGFVTTTTPSPGSAGNLTSIFVALAAWCLVAGTLVIAVAALVARYSSRSLRSVQAVTHASTQLGQGDYDHRVPVGPDEETRRLTDSFNTMADTIKGVIGRLSAERDTLSAVLDTMADGVIVTERTGRVALLNPASRELLGIRPEAVQGLRLAELMRDNEIHQLINVCQEEKSRQQAEISLILPRRYLSAIATPLDNDEGVLLTLHDLTRMQQVETSQKEFVSNVSHELRNPMASIKAMVETLESGAVNEPQVAMDFLARMRGDVDRINGLVNDLLELSRMESGQFRIDVEPISLAPVVQTVERQFGDTAATQGVEIVSKLHDDLPLVMADGEKLTQVFVNLVENALKFTPADGEISIQAEPFDEYVQVQLQDTGIGVAPQHVPHLFERFYKVNRSRRDSGTGLGLSIVKQLVEAHGGQISVASKEGEGCAFTFTVPRARQEVQPGSFP